MTPGLIERLEAAGGPGIVLEAEIFWTLERDRATTAFWRGAMGRPGSLPEEFARLPRGLGMASMEAASPNYTASLDAALALAERVLPGWEFGTYISRPDVHGNRQTKIEARRWQDVAPEYAFACASSSARTPALALCIAILKARATQGQTHG